MMTEVDPAQPRAVVWIVDDLRSDVASLTRLLSVDFDLTVFEDGPQMLERLKSATPPDVLVIEQWLRGLTGVEICRVIRASPSTVGLPILLLTVPVDDDEILEGLAAGADDYLIKPFSPALLAARIGSLLRVKRLRERAQAARLEAHVQHERLTTAFTQAPVAVGILRGDADVVVLANDAVCRIWGFSHAALIGQPIFDLLVDAKTQGFPELLAQVRRTGEPFVGREVSASLPRLDGRGVEAVILNFVYQPLRAADGSMTDILVMATDVTVVDLYALTEATIREVEMTYPNRTIELLQAGNTRGTWDADRLAQVVTNLVTNALKYSLAETPVAVSTATRDGMMELTVHNDGPPIPAERLGQLFEPLQRATEEIDFKTRSVGLGLYIVDAIVKAHGGTVGVVSTAEAGTTFKVRLPRELPATPLSQGAAQ